MKKGYILLHIIIIIAHSHTHARQLIMSAIVSINGVEATVLEARTDPAAIANPETTFEKITGSPEFAAEVSRLSDLMSGAIKVPKSEKPMIGGIVGSQILEILVFGPKRFVISKISMTFRGGFVPLSAIEKSVLYNLEHLICYPPFQNWRDEIEQQTVDLRNAQHIGTDMFGPVIVGFTKIAAEIWSEGVRLPGYVQLRKDCVAILAIFIDEETGQEFIALVEQRRAANGAQPTLETVAGIQDKPGSAECNALQEVCEELGFAKGDKIILNGLQNIGRIDPSCGLTREKIDMFLFEVKVSHSVIDSLRGKSTGVKKEGEAIKVRVFPLDWKILQEAGIMDAKLWAGLTLRQLFKQSATAAAVGGGGGAAAACSDE